jgi:hypothetical protein
MAVGKVSNATPDERGKNAKMLRISAILAIAVFFSTGVGATNLALFDAAYDAQRAGQNVKAAKLYRQIIEKKKDYVGESIVQLSQTLYASGETLAAENLLRRHMEKAKKANRFCELRAERFELQHIYEMERKKINNDLDDKHCPICGSEEAVIPITYGLVRGRPGSGEQLPEAKDKGCMVAFGHPKWWCKKDKTEF